MTFSVMYSALSSSLPVSQASRVVVNFAGGRAMAAGHTNNEWEALEDSVASLHDWPQTTDLQQVFKILHFVLTVKGVRC